MGKHHKRKRSSSKERWTIESLGKKVEELTSALTHLARNDYRTTESRCRSPRKRSPSSSQSRSRSRSNRRQSRRRYGSSQRSSNESISNNYQEAEATINSKKDETQLETGNILNDKDEDVLIIDTELDDETKQLLGEAPKDPILFGPAIHKELVIRFDSIVTKGLSQEECSILCNKNSVPSNCKLLTAPELNNEIKSILMDYSKERDGQLKEMQRQTGCAISAVGSVMTNLLNCQKGSEVSNVMLTGLNDAAKILCDLHHKFSLKRKSLITTNIKSKILKSAVADSLTDHMLFGAELDKRIKQKEDLEKLGKNLMTPKSGSKSTKAVQPKVKSSVYIPKPTLNSYRPSQYSRQDQRKTYSRGGLQRRR